MFNIGDAYDNQTGEFKCPVDGLYSFYTQVPHDFTSRLPKEQGGDSLAGGEIILKVNDEYKISWDHDAYAGVNGGPGYLSFHHVNGLLQLKKNDIVSIQLQGQFSYGSNFLTLNVFFQGHLIHPL